MKFSLRTFACTLTIFWAFEIILPCVGFSIPVFMENITTSGWRDIEDRLVRYRNITALQKQQKILSKLCKADIIINETRHIVAATSPIKIMQMVESSTVSNYIRTRFIWLLYAIEKIDKNYNIMRNYAKSRMNSDTIEDLINIVISHRDYSVMQLTANIHHVFVPKHELLETLIKRSTALNENIVHELGQSPHQFFYNLYSRIILTQIKAYAMMQLSYQLREICKTNGAFISEMKLTRSNFIRRWNETADGMKKVLKKLSTHFWKNDPPEYEEGVNYLEVTRLGQGYIVNEKILGNGQCFSKCAIYEEANLRSYLDDVFYRYSRCYGKMYSCKDLSSSSIYVCPAYMRPSRKYNYIGMPDEVMGSKTVCPVKLIQVEPRRDSCPYCFCLCDDSGPLSDRYFSLRQAVSDVKRNRVATGVRFVKKNRMIHLQVQQGELLSHGVIDSDTLEWVPIDNFRLLDRFVYNEQDYFKLDWKNRAIDLHILPDNDRGDALLTGIRFKTISNMPETHLNLEIRVTRFRFETGELYTESTTWIDNLSTPFSNPNSRTEITLGEVDVPTKASQNEPKSEGNQYVRFTHTAYDKDAAQTTVPFIDAQDVVPNAPTPLIGAGLYFKRQEGFGGFLSLKLVTYDFSKHL